MYRKTSVKLLVNSVKIGDNEKIMYLKLIVTLLLVCTTVISDEDVEAEEETSTIVLGDDFAEKIKENNYFVEFYAPWLVHQSHDLFI